MDRESSSPGKQDGEMYASMCVLLTHSHGNRADLRSSLAAYENLLTSAKAFRSAMLQLAGASANFASSLEDCARQKGAATERPGEDSSSGEQLLAAAGLHHLMCNHEQVLVCSILFLFPRHEYPEADDLSLLSGQSNVLHQEFEIPLLEHYNGQRWFPSSGLPEPPPKQHLPQIIGEP
jgi:hypothetical protein